MNPNEKRIAKAALVVTVIKYHSNAFKAYLALAAAGVYSVRAIREYRDELNVVTNDLEKELARPVVSHP